MRRVRFGVVGLLLILMSVTFGVGVYAAANPRVSLSGEVTYTPRTKESYLYKDWKVTLNSNGISPSSITSVKFTRNESDIPSGVTGVSVGANDATNGTPFEESNSTYYNVMAYKNGNALVLFSKVPIFAPEDSSYLFSHASNSSLRFSSATSFDFANLDTTRTTSMSGMMANLNKVSNLDLSSFNTEKVASMANMFDGCTSLTDVNLTSFKTEKVSSMNSMFNNCSALTSLNLSSFSVSSGTNVTSLLNGCSNLNTINAPKSNAVAISLPTQTTSSYYKTTALSTALTTIPVSSATSTIKLGYNLTANANNGSISASTGWTGTGSTASKVVLFDNNAIGTLPSAARTNYSLKGWFTATTGGTQIATTTKFTQNSSIFAQWNANTYNITYNMNNGTNPSNNPTTFTFSESTQTKTLTNPTRTGYNFNGWTATNGSISGNTLTINAGATSVTLTANWEAQVYAITYKDQGGATFSGTHAAGTPTQHTYDKATTLKDPTKTGYTFGGWFTNSACTGNAITSLSATGYTGNITLYAKWNAGTGIGYKVEHYQEKLDIATPNTSNAAHWDLVDTDNKEGTTGASVTPSVNTYTGFTAPATQTVTILADGSLVVKYYYTRNVYTLTVKAGTGISSVTGGASYDYGKSITVGAVVKTGYTWANWTSSNTGLLANSTTNAYNFTMPAGAVELTANASANTITITLNNQSATTAGSTAVYYKYNTNAYYSNSACTTTLNSITVPLKTGYTFGGYFTEINGAGTQYISNTGTFLNNLYSAVSGNITLYAKWTVINYDYNVNINSNTTTATKVSVTANGTTKDVTLTAGANKTSTLNFSIPYGTKFTPSATFTTVSGKSYNLVWGTTAVATPTTAAVSGTQKTMGASTVTDTITFSELFSLTTQSNNTNYGTVSPASTTVVYGGSVSISATPTNATGYTTVFTSWAKTSGTCTITSTTTANTTVTGITANSVVTATFTRTANKYNITYKDQGNVAFSGTHASGYPTQHTYGTATTLKTASKTGYTFGGWFTSSDCSGTAVTSLGATTYTSAITLYAKWTAVNYTITINNNNGTGGAVNNATYNIGTSSQTRILTNPTRSGYTFSSWTVSGHTGTIPTVSGTTLTIPANTYGNLTLTANWTAVNYTITINNNNGTGGAVNNATYNIGTSSQTRTLTNPTRAGYTFSSWTVSGHTGTIPTVSGTTLTIPANTYGNLTLTANWTTNTYTISYVMDGGTNPTSNPTSFSYSESTQTKTIANPTKTGYSFNGWTVENGSITGTTLTINAKATSVKLTANWTKNSYKYTVTVNMTGTAQTVTVTANGTSKTVTTNGGKAEFDIPYNTTFTPSVKVAYTSGKYNLVWGTTSVASVVATNTAVNRSSALTMGTSGLSDTVTLKQLYYVNINLSNNVTNAPTYYVGTSSNPTTTVTGNTTYYYLTNTAVSLYAKVTFSSNVYNYTFGTAAATSTSSGTVVNTGSVTPTYTGATKTLTVSQLFTITAQASGNGTVTPSSATYVLRNGSYNITATPTNATGYATVFTSWAKTSGTCTITSTTTANTTVTGITANSVVTATFTRTANKYNITYKDQGDATFSGTHASGYPTQHTYGTATTLKTASKTGYTFGGWFTSSDCSGTAVTSLGATAYSADITLYAKWTAQTYNITYKDQGNVAFSGTHPSNQPTTFTYGTLTRILSPTKIGYTFEGWYNDSACTSKISSILVGTEYTSDFTLYAKWGINNYSILAVANGGTFQTTTGWTIVTGRGYSKTLDYNQVYGTLPTVTREGYAFKGWFTSASGGTQVTSSTKMGTANVTIYAQWNANTYNITYVMDGGTNPSSNPTTFTYSESTQTKTIANPTKTGYTFGGWTVTNGSISGTTLTIDAKATSVTLTANWSASNITLTASYVGNGYNLNAPLNLESNKTVYIVVVGFSEGEYNISAYESLEEAGMGFFYCEINAVVYSGNYEIINNQVVKITTGTSNTTISLKYTTLTANSNGGNIEYTSGWIGSGDSAYKGITSGAQYGDFPTVTKTGYTLSGWYTALTGGTQVTSTTTMGSNSTTIYARWTPSTYYLAMQGCENAFENPSVNYDEVITVSAGTNGNNIFKGWELSSISSSIDYNTARWGTSADNVNNRFSDDGIINCTGTIYLKNLSSSGAGVNGYVFNAIFENYSKEVYLLWYLNDTFSTAEMVDTAILGGSGTPIKLLDKDGTKYFPYVTGSILNATLNGSASIDFSEFLSTPLAAYSGYSKLSIFINTKASTPEGLKIEDESQLEEEILNITKDTVIILRFYSNDYNRDPFLSLGGKHYYVNPANKKIYTSYDGTTYSSEINGITVPTISGKGYLGAFDTSTETGGTQYVNADGTFTTAARNITESITIYNRYLLALATNLKYEVRYSATSEYASVYMTWEKYWDEAEIDYWTVALYKDGSQIASQEVTSNTFELYDNTLSTTAGTYYFTVKGQSMTPGYTNSTASTSATREAYRIKFGTETGLTLADGYLYGGGKFMGGNRTSVIVAGANGDKAPVFTRVGCEFNAWCVLNEMQPDSPDTFVNTIQIPAYVAMMGETSFTAFTRWAVDEMSVDFILADGQDLVTDLPNERVSSGEWIVTIKVGDVAPKAVRSGYTFMGWATSVGGSVVFKETFDPTVDLNGDIVTKYYAVWDRVAPKNINVSSSQGKTTITWGEVDGVHGYMVIIESTLNDVTIYESDIITQTSCSLTLGSGEYKVIVRSAYDNEYGSYTTIPSRVYYFEV